MENVLIVSSSKNAAEALAGFIREAFQCSIRGAESSYQAKGIFSGENSIELALINAPLMDESGLELAEYITENTAAGCILIVKPEFAEKAAERAEKNGIIVVSRPFNRNVLYQLIKAVDITVRRSLRMYQETVRLEKKIDEIKTIDKAKFLLMEFKQMTEAQSHEYLEQYAMNKRKKKYIAALEIIDKINEQYL